MNNETPAFSDRGSWRFDAAVFTGLDFYVYKGLYIGTELGLGLKTSKTGKIKTTRETRFEGRTEITNIQDNNIRLSQTTFGFFIEPTLRLGWTF